MRRGNNLLGGVGKKIVGDTADLVPRTVKVWPNNNPMNGTKYRLEQQLASPDLIFLCRSVFPNRERICIIIETAIAGCRG